MGGGADAVLSEPARDTALTLRRWSIADWLANEAAWGRLLLRSNADALFQSWEWLTLWWQCFGDTLAAVPQILAFERSGELVGVAPLYRRRVIRHGLLPTSSVQLIGLSWRDPAAPISEYLDVVATVDEADAVRRACVQAMHGEEAWTEWVIGFTAAGREWREAFARLELGQHQYVRDVDPSVSYQADLSQGFDGYLRSLAQSTRRSVWNLRRRLALQGAVSLESVSSEDSDGAFSELNRLHRLRWQQPAVAGASLEFHSRLARRLAARGELAMSRLRVGGQVVSVLYDIRKGARQYNISMGFDPAFGRKVSVGLLHLGYAMEAAAEHGVSTYDFLAGSGLRSDYKRHLSQASRRLSCIQVLRGYLLPSLYRWHDRVH